VGADRIADGDELYGQPFSKTDQHGDTYGPVTYLLYVPFEQVLPWEGKPDPAAAHAAAVAFDLLVIVGLLLLGRRLRGWPLGVGLAYGWAANPYSLFVLQSNANDAAVAILLVWALVLLASPVGRGAFVALAAAAKFSPAALVPLFAHDRRPKNVVAYGLAIAVVLIAVFVAFVPDGGFREIYDRTIGFQLARESPFSVWGQEESLAPLHTALKVGAALLALCVAFVPRRRSPVQVAALAAAVVIAVQLVVTHWFYLYVVWFLPLVLVALLAPLAVGRREALGPGLELDAAGVDHLRDQAVPAGAHHQLQ
jgi:Glycosyltransferase family 87